MWDLDTLRRMNGTKPEDTPLGPITLGEYERQRRLPYRLRRWIRSLGTAALRLTMHAKADAPPREARSSRTAGRAAAGERSGPALARPARPARLEACQKAQTGSGSPR